MKEGVINRILGIGWVDKVLERRLEERMEVFREGVSQDLIKTVFGDD